MTFTEFIKKYYFIAIFIIIEIFAISITSYRNNRVNAFVVNSSNSIISFFVKKIMFVDNYFNLVKENKKLVEENRKLYSKVQIFDKEDDVYFSYDEKSKLLKWKYISGIIVNHFVVNQNNYFTINKGVKDSIESDMGVFNSDGVIGVTTNVSAHNCIVLSVFNTKTYISCKLHNTNYYGIAHWNAKSINFLEVEQIPNHIPLKIGDSIVTSGISKYFPEDILVGTVDTFYKNPNNNFYQIRLKTGFKVNEIKNVYIVKNLNLGERKLLEEQIK